MQKGGLGGLRYTVFGGVLDSEFGSGFRIRVWIQNSGLDSVFGILYSEYRIRNTEYWSLRQKAKLAGWKGLEPSAFRVTGGRYNQLNYHPARESRERNLYWPYRILSTIIFLDF